MNDRAAALRIEIPTLSQSQQTKVDRRGKGPSRKRPPLEARVSADLQQESPSFSELQYRPRLGSIEWTSVDIEAIHGR